jgi:hypothetical protein
MEDVNRVTDQVVQVQQALPCAEKPSQRELYIRALGILGYRMPMNLKFQCLEVRESPRHGLGVFTRKAVARGTVMTVYPAHVISYLGEELIDVQVDTTLWKRIEAYDPAHKFMLDYGFEIASHKVSLVGHPALRSASGLLGHMINDACGNIFQGLSAQQLYDEGPEQFFKRVLVDVLPHTNCEFLSDKHKCVVSAVARCDIRANEELLVSYGPYYWLSVAFGKQWAQTYPFLQELCPLS